LQWFKNKKEKIKKMGTKNELIKISKQYLDADLSVMAMSMPKKKPVCKCKIYQETKATYDDIDREFKKINATHLGVFGGYGNLDIIDVDVSHDPTKLICIQYCDLLKAHLPSLYPRLVIDQSISGGIHIYFKCKDSGRSKRLASIPEDGKPRELICIKGKGGYVIISPSPGYTCIQGSLFDIPWIEPEERELMIRLAKSFDLRPIKIERNSNGK
jgi:hypothetical protein